MRSIFFIVMSFVLPVHAEQAVDQFIKFNQFQLEKTELKEIISILGETKIHKEGDAGESYAGICYFYPIQNVTVFYESREMGGGTTLLSYKFYNGEINRFPCATIRDEGNIEFTLGGLKIGQPTKEALLFLPKNPESIRGDSYSYWNKIPFTENDYIRTGVNKSDNPVWDEIVTIELYERNSIITGFGVYRVITW